jgi:hypothetical protein
MLLRAAATDVQGIFGDEQATAVARRAYRFCVAHHLDMSGIKEPSSLFYIQEETTVAFKIVAGCLKACEFRIGVRSLEQKTQQAALSTTSPPNGSTPLPPTATELVGSPSPFARLVQQQAAQRKRDAEAQAAWDEGVRRLREFRAFWSGAWERLLSNFDTNDKYRLVDANAAGAALAEVGALMNRLGEVRSDMHDCPATDRLGTLAESDQWRGVSPQTAAAILCEAARGIGVDELARMLVHAEGDPALRSAFGWLEFYRDRLLSQPGRTHPIGFIETTEALPVVECHLNDIRFAELWLCGLPPRKDLIARAVEELRALAPESANAINEEPEPAGHVPTQGNESRDEQGEGAAETETAAIEEGQDTGTQPQLTTRQADILCALLRLNATGQTRRVSREDVAQEINRTWDETKVARDFRYLSRLSYTDSQTGPDGGVWLSPKGRQRAEELQAEEGN